eukprot:48305_6
MAVLIALAYGNGRSQRYHTYIYMYTHTRIARIASSSLTFDGRQPGAPIYMGRYMGDVPSMLGALLQPMGSALAVFFLSAAVITALVILGLALVCRVRRFFTSTGAAVAFFHPYCNDGGGGERVLWVGIAALLKRRPGLRCVVYTGDDIEPAQILRNVKDRFGLELPGASIGFIYLTQRHWVEAKRYPRLTLLGQSMGSMVLAAEAVLRYAAPVFVDTTGYAFSFPVARYIGGWRGGGLRRRH